MDLSFPDAEAIDTLCERKVSDPNAAETASRCKGETVTWFETKRGSRLYVCETHAKETLRFGEDPDGVLDMSDEELEDYATEQGVNPSDYGTDELVRRLLSGLDASTLSPHPRVSPCRSCLKLTLYDDLGTVEQHCPACREGRLELSPE